METALDNGLSEFDFWEMTLGEVDRFIESKIRVRKYEETQRAIADYALANLIGHSVARIYNSKNQMPSLQDAYPHLFSEFKPSQEEVEDKTAEISAIRFKMFADNFNKQFEKEK